jgi:hypothetical protein
VAKLKGHDIGLHFLNCPGSLGGLDDCYLMLFWDLQSW